MSRESRPPILLDCDQSVDDLYAYHFQLAPNPFFTKRVVHPLTALFFRSERSFEGNTEEEVGDHLAVGGQLVMAFDHSSVLDPFVIAGEIHAIRAWRSMEANSVIPAKPTLYNNAFVAWILDLGGAHPAPRSKDKDNPRFQAQGTPEEIRDRLHRAGTHVVNLDIHHLNESRNVVLFPGSERRDLHNSQITSGSLRQGVGRIACGADDPANIRILTGAINYERGMRHPKVAYGSLLEVPDTPEEVMAMVVPDIRDCAERAAEMAAK